MSGVDDQCRFDGCDRSVYSDGYCFHHAKRARRGIDMNLPLPPRAICCIDGCERTVASKQMCGRHYIHYWRVAKRCKQEGCSRQRWANGYCSTHENRRKEGIPLDAPVVFGQTGCKRPGCDGEHYGRGLCHKHHMQAWRDGTLEGPSQYDARKQVG